jgi:Cu+-exporting ATPase
MFAAAAMSLSSVSVVSNALRLRLFRSETAKSKQKRGTSDGAKNYHRGNELRALFGEGGEGACRPGRGVGGGGSPSGTAIVTLSGNVSDEALISAVTGAGYRVISIS